MPAKHSVAILDGGVGGLSTAHELAERGFSVTVYERNATFGGKARSLSLVEEVLVFAGCAKLSGSAR